MALQLRLGGQPLPPLSRFRIYVCGITPYDTTHLGHASTFTWVDTFARVLDHAGVQVQLCRNVTDVDDALVHEAARRQVAWQALATQQTAQFEDDMRKLRVRRPSFEPQSREYITEVVFLARALLDTGAAYERDGSVLFRGAEVPERAGLSRSAAEAALEATDHPNLGDDPLDVPVWQASSGDDPAWDSPWGPGRPGWHAECAAMATAILGLSVDVHGGGSDLAFPHHAYEAALVEAATGVAPFARAWMHIGEVGVGGEKMAKSTGNLVLIFDLLREWQPEVVRLLILDRPWDAAWSYEPALLDRAAARLDDLRSAAGRGGDDEVAIGEVLGRLCNGLDVPGALAVADESGGEAAALCLSLLGLT